MQAGLRAAQMSRGFRFVQVLLWCFPAWSIPSQHQPYPAALEHVTSWVESVFLLICCLEACSVKQCPRPTLPLPLFPQTAYSIFSFLHFLITTCSENSLSEVCMIQIKLKLWTVRIYSISKGSQNHSVLTTVTPNPSYQHIVKLMEEESDQLMFCMPPWLCRDTYHLPPINSMVSV